MTETTSVAEPRILTRSEHPISRQDISEHALKVLYRLHRSGFRALLVGGGVRDLMVGQTPKDFDVVTDARPNEIRRLFRNSRTIGRRFRLVHVYFHQAIVEVSTFRRVPDPDEQDSHPDDLLITSDNTWGTPREDAFRRDFTVNAMFYDIADFSVIDYVGAIEDLDRKLIRVIGNPDVRFQEDPVRMLRACEFAARLDFGIDRATQRSIERHSQLLNKASPPRVTEEIIQLLRTGCCDEALRWLYDLGLLTELLPEAEAMLEASRAGVDELERLPAAIDSLIAEDHYFSDGGLLAALLLPAVLLRRLGLGADGRRRSSRRSPEAIIEDVLEPFAARFALSRARTQEVFATLQAFQRLGAAAASEDARRRAVRRPSFDGALSLVEVMVRASGEGRELLDLWQESARRFGRKKKKQKSIPERPEIPTQGRRRRGPRRRRRRR